MGSVTEIGLAHELGAEVVKIFPGSQVGGPGFVKAVLGPMPWSSIMPTGGVTPTEENLKEWFSAGVTCCGGWGSQLFPKSVIENKDFSVVTEKCKEALDIVKRTKSINKII